MRSRRLICFNVKKTIKINALNERNKLHLLPTRRRNAVSYCTRKLFCRYKNILHRRSRINDISSYIRSNSSFPLNEDEFKYLLLRAQDDAEFVLTLIYSLDPNNSQLTMLNDLCGPIQANHALLERPLTEDLATCEKSTMKSLMSSVISNMAKCVAILKNYNETIHLMSTSKLIRELEYYLGGLKTVCAFIYLIILKKRSSFVNRLLPTIPSNRILYCDICYKEDSRCRCLNDSESSSSQDSSSYSSKNFADEDKSKPLVNDPFRITSPDSYFMSSYLSQLDEASRPQLAEELRRFRLQHSAHLPEFRENSPPENNRHLNYNPPEDSSDTD